MLWWVYSLTCRGDNERRLRLKGAVSSNEAGNLLEGGGFDELVAADIHRGESEVVADEHIKERLHSGFGKIIVRKIQIPQRGIVGKNLPHRVRYRFAFGWEIRD